MEGCHMHLQVFWNLVQCKILSGIINPASGILSIKSRKIQFSGAWENETTLLALNVLVMPMGVT